MNKELQKVLTSLVCLLIILNSFYIEKADATQTLYMTQNKNYKVENQVYKLEFNDQLSVYASQEAWRFTDENNAIVKDGRLYCVSNKSYSIRSGLILGNEYALEKNPIKFNMLMENGTVSVGVRLKSTVSTKDTGIWFHINNNTVNITTGGTELNVEVKHNLLLNTERTYSIVNSDDKISLYISNEGKEALIAYIEYEYEGNLTVKDSSDKTIGSPVKNTRTPHTGFWRMNVNSLVGYIDNLEYVYNIIIPDEYPTSSQRLVDYSTWVATDDLNRATPINTDTGNVKKDKYVGLFYFLNHTNDREGVINDVTKIYMEQGLDKLKNILPETLGVYWAEPYFGYYLNTDEWVFRKHAYMFTAAGIDFIFLDFSNNVVYEKELKTLLDTWLNIRKEGGQTPQIVCMAGDMPHVLIHDLYILKNIMYSKPEYEELFFKWEDKPLILGNNDNPEGGDWTVSEETVGEYSKDKMLSFLTAEEKQFYQSGDFNKELIKFTVRKSWARQSRKYENDKKYAGYWDWLDDWPQGYGRNFSGKKEQMSVSIAATAMTHKGRSYIKGIIEYGTGLEDFDFTLGKAQYGLYFEEQFEHALEANPSVIMITGWNEWSAGKQKNEFPNMRTGHTSTPYYHFVDQFNPEFSRDAEPMKVRDGVGFGDNYYYQMVNFIRKFKGIDPILGCQQTNGINFKVELPDSSERLSMVDSKVLSDWDKVDMVYMDTLGDTTFRNYPSMGLQYNYLNASGRNDLEYAKVTTDKVNVYFLIKTFKGIVTEDESNWMNLYIDIDKNHKTGWEGYDYVINRSRDGSKVSVEKFVDNSWKLENIGNTDYFMGTDNLTIKVSKELLGIKGENISFDFKWSDNSTTKGNVMQFMDIGDSAPNDRFNYRFSTTDIRYKSKSIFTLKNIVIVVILIIVLATITFYIAKRQKKKGNKKMKRIIFLTVVLLMTALIFTACNKKGKDDKDETKTTPVATAAPTEQAGTPTAKTSPTVPPVTLKPITNKGLPQKDSEVLLVEDFEDGQFNLDEFELVLEEYLEISEGQMHITKEWSAVAPIYEYELDTKHNQYEFSMDYNSTFDRLSAPHVAYWVGCRVPKEKYAAYPGGFWLAFTQNKVIHVYPGGDNFEGKEHWSEKFFDIEAPENFKSVHKITVVDTGDAVYYYMNTATEENYLLLKAVFDGADLICYDKDGQEIWAGENAVNLEVGFSIFSHRSATHTDNITLKAH